MLIKDKIYFKEGTTKILTLKLACKVIDEVSKLNLDEVEKEVKKKMIQNGANIKS